MRRACSARASARRAWAWVWRPLARRYPLVNPPRALAFAVGAGAAGAGFAAFALWFLKVPGGWWTPAIVSGAGALAALVRASVAAGAA